MANKSLSAPRRSRAKHPPYERNIQSFAGAVASGRTVDPMAHARAMDSIVLVKKQKDAEHIRKNKEVTDAAAEVLAAYNKSKEKS